MGPAPASRQGPGQSEFLHTSWITAAPVSCMAITIQVHAFREVAWPCNLSADNCTSQSHPV